MNRSDEKLAKKLTEDFFSALCAIRCTPVEFMEILEDVENHLDIQIEATKDDIRRFEEGEL